LSAQEKWRKRASVETEKKGRIQVNFSLRKRSFSKSFSVKDEEIAQEFADALGHWGFKVEVKKVANSSV